MSEKTLNSRIIHKHDVEANWLKATGFIPKQGELIVYDIDSTHNYERFKIGDGKTTVSALPFADDAVKSVIAAHNNSGTAHSDIRASISELETLVGDKSVSKQINTAIADKADAVHTHSEYVNQKAFSNVVVGSTTIAADTTTDTLTVVAGDNVTITPDATNDKITIAATDTVYTHPSYTARTGVPTANQTPGFGGTFTVSQPVSDATGHITAVNSRTITIPNAAATTSAAGLMSAADKTKLDGVATGANKTTVDSTLSSSSTNPVQNKVVNAAISNLNTLVGDTSVAAQIAAANMIYVGPTEPTDSNIKVWINTAEEGTGVIPVLPRVTTISLPKANWIGSAEPYHQVVSVNTVTSATKIDLQPTAQQIVNLQNAEISLMIENNGGVVTCYAIGNKPTADYTMQVLLQEVSYV